MKKPSHQLQEHPATNSAEYPQHGIQALTLALFMALSSAGSGQSFINTAMEQGVDVLVNGGLFGSGLSFYDFDQDGWDDITLCIKEDSLVFYRNEEGQMVRSPSFLYGPGETKHVLWVDYDNDGDMDLTVTTWQGTYRLYNNDGQFNFTDVSVIAGLAQNVENTYGVSWGDFDRDGYLDLYVCVYEFEGDQNNFSRMNHLYRNNGDGTFTDVSIAAGVTDGIKMSFQAVWLDYNRDGWPDLYVINDRWFSNSLYRNNGNGTFSDVTMTSGTAVTGQDPMTASVADFDNDGDLDIYMSNTGFFERRGMLLVNNDDGTFTERGAEFGVDIQTWSWGATWADVDNDGWQDLYVTTSLPNGTIMDNVFYHSVGGEVFVEAPNLFQGDHNARSFAVARGDIDNDGYYDLAVQNQDPYKPFLWANTGGQNKYVKVTLQGTISNRMAIGSWIKVYAGGSCHTQYTHCGENYTSQNSQHHIIGIGQAVQVDSITVVYLSGHFDTYYDLAVDQHYLFVEGDTYTAVVTPLGGTLFCSGANVVLDAGDHAGYLWNNGYTGRFLTVSESGQYWFMAWNSLGVQAQSDTATVMVAPLPTIEATTQNPLCAGTSTGLIVLENLSGTAAQEVSWNTGASGASLDALPAGNYTYAYTDIQGCLSSGSIELIDPPELFIQVSATPDLGGGTGTLSLSIFGGVPPYTITLNGANAALDNTGLTTGMYSLMIMDAYGCIIEEQVYLDAFSGLSEEHDELFNLYPNPTAGFITADLPSAPAVLLITESGGRVVHLERTAGSMSIDLTHLAHGHYIMHVIPADGRLLRRAFVKD